MGILLRLIKVVFGICLIPVWLIVIIFGYLIVIPILLVADLFKYIITGKAGLADWFVIDSDSLFSFEGLTFGGKAREAYASLAASNWRRS